MTHISLYFYNYFEMREATDYIRDNLKDYYPDFEIESISYLIFEHVLGYSRLQVNLKRGEEIENGKMQIIKEIVDRLRNYEPIQYILGETEFYGLKFKVTPDVLIPRPETEELIDWIIQENKEESLRVLDIGTGSGCIPVALSNNIQGAKVAGWDISERALKIAKENAGTNNADVNFLKVDILNWRNLIINTTYDIIVSNPPYVRILEKDRMSPNVLKNEPHLALFVPDEDPLVFYREITSFASKYLNKGGKLYFEINEAFGPNTVKLLQDAGFKDIYLRKDIPGKDRMIRAIR